MGCHSKLQHSGDHYTWGSPVTVGAYERMYTGPHYNCVGLLMKDLYSYLNVDLRFTENLTLKKKIDVTPSLRSSVNTYP